MVCRHTRQDVTIVYAHTTPLTMSLMPTRFFESPMMVDASRRAPRRLAFYVMSPRRAPCLMPTLIVAAERASDITPDGRPYLPRRRCFVCRPPREYFLLRDAAEEPMPPRRLMLSSPPRLTLFLRRRRYAQSAEATLSPHACQQRRRRWRVREFADERVALICLAPYAFIRDEDAAPRRSGVYAAAMRDAVMINEAPR